MSGIAASMEKKGYTALMADGYAGIGFRGSLNKTSRRFPEPVWFDIGRKIKDKDGNECPMTVAAHDSAQYEEYLKKGWKPVLSQAEGPLEAEKKEEGKEEKQGKEERTIFIPQPLPLFSVLEAEKKEACPEQSRREEKEMKKRGKK